MESWDQVIHTALLGTEKKVIHKGELADSFSESLDLITAQTDDREETFLQIAALVYNFRQCGFMPIKKETVSLPKAANEEKEYASSEALVVLSDIVATGSVSLLRFWLEQCNGADQIVQSDFLPLLLNTGTKQKELRDVIKAVAGKRGEWIVQFNEDWKWNEVVDEEETWQTGKLAQRKIHLMHVRKNDPAKGKEMLQQTWLQEPAITKAELLEAMMINASDEDVHWLEELLNEKSVKVKEAALQILKTIPGSTIVRTYWNIVKNSVHLTTAKGILGIGSKTALTIKLTGIEPAIFKTGIQQVSSEKGESDEAFILCQLIESVPPHFFEEHLKLNSEEITKLFMKEDATKTLLPALGKASIRFKDIHWLRVVIAVDEKNIYSDALGLLPQKEAEAYALKFFTNDDTAVRIIQSLHYFHNEWSTEFAKAVLRFTAKNGHQYHRGFYNEMIHLLPVPIIGELEKCTPKEEYLRTMWNNVSEHISGLLTLKLQSLKAFNE